MRFSSDKNGRDDVSGQDVVSRKPQGVQTVNRLAHLDLEIHLIGLSAYMPLGEDVIDFHQRLIKSTSLLLYLHLHSPLSNQIDHLVSHRTLHRPRRECPTHHRWRRLRRSAKLAKPTTRPPPAGQRMQIRLPRLRKRKARPAHVVLQGPQVYLAQQPREDYRSRNAAYAASVLWQGTRDGVVELVYNGRGDALGFRQTSG